MRVLVLGEGPNDLGRFRDDGICEQKGALPVLSERLVKPRLPNDPIEFFLRPWKTVRRFPNRSRKARGFGNKLLAVAAEDVGRFADAIVAVVDRDGDMNQGRLQHLLDAKNELSAAGRRCAVGLAIETIEAWLLADDNALRQALNNPTIVRQPDPESLDAKGPDNDRHPKHRLRQLIDQSVVGLVPATDYSTHYARIAELADLNIVSIRCPRGFEPFTRQISDGIV